MKTNKWWRFLPLILITIYSCSPKKEKGELVYFSGRIANAQTDSIYLLLNNREKAFALDFDGNFNMMIEMMAKKPLTSFIETIAENIGKIA